MVDLRLAKFSYDKWITSAKHDDPLPGLLCSTDFIIKWRGRSSLFRSSGSWGFLQNCAPRYRGNSYVNSYAGPKCMLSSSFQPNLFGRTFPTILKWADKDTKETSLPLIFLANFQAFFSPSTRLTLVTWSWVKDKQNWRFMEQPGTGLACPHDTCVLDPGLNMKHSILSSSLTCNDTWRALQVMREVNFIASFCCSGKQSSFFIPHFLGRRTLF